MVPQSDEDRSTFRYNSSLQNNTFLKILNGTSKFLKICVCVCVCVIGVLCRFQKMFSYITTLAACCMRCDSPRVLSPANTDSPCHRHKTHLLNTQSYYPETEANQSWLYPLNSQPVPFLTPMVRHSLNSNL